MSEKLNPCPYCDGDHTYCTGPIDRTQPEAVTNAGDVTPKQGWKCNCCRQIFTHEQKERKPDSNGGAPCPFCKAHGQYTYPFQLHDGDPYKNCGKPHDDVESGECRAATAEADLAKARESLDAANAKCELLQRIVATFSLEGLSTTEIALLTEAKELLK